MQLTAAWIVARTCAEGESRAKVVVETNSLRWRVHSANSIRAQSFETKCVRESAVLAPVREGRRLVEGPKRDALSCGDDRPCTPRHSVQPGGMIYSPRYVCTHLAKNQWSRRNAARRTSSGPSRSRRGPSSIRRSCDRNWRRSVPLSSESQFLGSVYRRGSRLTLPEETSTATASTCCVASWAAVGKASAKGRPC